MLFKKKWLLVLLLALVPAAAFADGDARDTHVGLALPGLGQSQFSGANQGLSLLDPQRIDMSQSYGLVYSTDGRNGDLVGLYQNLLSYRFSPRLNLKFNLGYYHQPFAAGSAASSLKSQALMTAFQLDFQPFDNVFIRFNYQSLPANDYRSSFLR